MKSSAVAKKPYWEMLVQVKKRNMTPMVKDKQIFLFRKEAGEANEERELVPKR